MGTESEISRGDVTHPKRRGTGSCSLLWGGHTDTSWKIVGLAMTVTYRLLTAEARFRSQTSACGLCIGQSRAGTDFSLSISVNLAVIIPAIFHTQTFVTDILEAYQLTATSYNP